ncbi:histone H1-like [Mixophyes fleayi]|uniref:histone H1-like n=1 Tax=Mixophyes fleayi TaxID=3061075 RepID=UPI003F4DCB64
MLETAPAAAPAAPAEAPVKGKRQPKKAAAGSSKKGNKTSGPSVSEQIVKCVSASKERSAVSLAALKKTLAAGGYDVEKNNSRLKVALKSLVTKETLIQVKGSGASGSFKLNKKQLESKDKAAKKKVAVVKPKKAAAKKVPKSPKKSPSAAKSPKKAKKPAAAKKAVKSPKKPKPAVKPKKAAKSPAKKAAKPKVAKSPAKKAAKPKVAKSPAKKAAKPKKAAPKKK